MRNEALKQEPISEREIKDFQSALADCIEEVVKHKSFPKVEEWVLKLPDTIRKGGKIPLGAMQDLFWGLMSEKRYLTNQNISALLEEKFLQK